MAAKRARHVAFEEEVDIEDKRSKNERYAEEGDTKVQRSKDYYIHYTCRCTRS